MTRYFWLIIGTFSGLFIGFRFLPEPKPLALDFAANSSQVFRLVACAVAGLAVGFAIDYVDLRWRRE